MCDAQGAFVTAGQSKQLSVLAGWLFGVVMIRASSSGTIRNVLRLASIVRRHVEVGRPAST